MEMYVIYEKLIDYPNKFVVRCFEVGAGAIIPTRRFALAGSLEDVRRLVPACMFRIERDPADESQIVECWI